ncbi:hypothetical protein C884_01246 [Kocuria palustris PEL]|uniref:DUF4352 domain-containing protein n=1 Tax=Kocuria palustris PEL TaxID=1236550 RepID=M2X9R6_9MICC|nr:hypothetical protein C884_01246 [Kocuria palustris PEL]
MSHPRHPLFAASLLGLTLALSGCTAQPSDEPEPAPETVTVTQTAPAEDQPSAEASPEAAEDSPSTEGDDSAEASGQASEAADSDAAAKPAADASGLSERGNIPKQIGEEASLTASSGEKALSFEVTDIQSDFQCTSPYAEAPENESFVKVDIMASTGSAEDLEELFYINSMMFNPYDWKFVDSSGRTANDIGTVASYMCLDTGESLPDEIGPGENVSGSLILDVTDSSGTLVYAPLFDSEGWEWSL